MDLELASKRALVTGASRGIGRAIASALAGEGCNLVLVARDAATLTLARDDLLRRYPCADIMVHAADLRDRVAIDALVGAFADVQIVVNNAGAIPHGNLLDVGDDEWADGWDLKVHGHIRMTRGFYRHMRERRQGVIVNVIGIAGERVMANYVAGSAGNAALIAFTRAVGSASPADGIRVVGVNPGPILTERLQSRLHARAKAELGDVARWPELMHSMPFERAGDPREIADVVAFLASPRAGYISGAIVNIDGGISNRSTPT
jgi:NAD(P)-dependent dehydrogenase (short-subunit alcohol dehydrogenase family)